MVTLESNVQQSNTQTCGTVGNIDKPQLKAMQLSCVVNDGSCLHAFHFLSGNIGDESSLPATCAFIYIITDTRDLNAMHGIIGMIINAGNLDAIEFPQNCIV